MGAGKKVYTYVSFSSQNNSNFMGLKILQIIATIEFLKNNVVQRSPLDIDLVWSEVLSNSPRCYHVETLTFMGHEIAGKCICDNCGL